MHAEHMEEFTNETINVAELPRFEEVSMTKLDPDYWKVLMVMLALTAFAIVIGLSALLTFNEDFAMNRTVVVSTAAGIFIVAILLARLSFIKKAYAFREHDVLFRHGIIATTTIVIPYNRVQHVAVHEGFLSRMFGLAKIGLFTAGGSASDIEIPGIRKQQAEDIKHLLMGKIRKDL